jgi:hypothetical protein
MAEKKTKRMKDIMPNVILVFVLLSTVLILIDISGNLINDGLLQIDSGADEAEPINTKQVESTPIGPTPTLAPIGDA